MEVTKKHFIVAICVILYIAVAIIVFSGSNAYFQWECHHRWETICDEDMVIRDRALATISAIFPPWWFASYVITGRFHHGYSFEATPSIKDVDKD